MKNQSTKEKSANSCGLNILFVCTGNTCRSPMAEGICRKILSENLKCPLDRLEEIGYKVASAGIYAACGSSASAEAVVALKAMDIDISSHISVQLTKKTVSWADIIFVLANSHLQYIIKNWPDAEAKTVVLDEVDIQDPIGLDSDMYIVCAKQIKDAILKRIGGYLNEGCSSK